ncbi:hypothetical protein OH77DRAFT_1154357 [Trametes cingulata]|nr:hypothetical protein OH77DRAFT_1154357 [Trametes cingulata]
MAGSWSLSGQLFLFVNVAPASHSTLNRRTLTPSRGSTVSASPLICTQIHVSGTGMDSVGAIDTMTRSRTGAPGARARRPSAKARTAESGRRAS